MTPRAPPRRGVRRRRPGGRPAHLAGYPPGTPPPRGPKGGRHARRRRGSWRLPAAAVTLTLAGMWLTIPSPPAGYAVYAAGILAALAWAARRPPGRGT